MLELPGAVKAVVFQGGVPGKLADIESSGGDACYDRGRMFELKCFLNDRAPYNPHPSFFNPCFAMFFVVKLGYGTVHRVLL